MDISKLNREDRVNCGPNVEAKVAFRSFLINLILFVLTGEYDVFPFR